MIYYGRASRRAAQVARSQLAVRLALALYALLAAAITLRCLVLVLSLPRSVWSVETIVSATTPIVFLLSRIPVANRAVLGAATLADLTAAIIVIALTLPLFGRRQ